MHLQQLFLSINDNLSAPKPHTELMSEGVLLTSDF